MKQVLHKAEDQSSTPRTHEKVGGREATSHSCPLTSSPPISQAQTPTQTKKSKIKVKPSTEANNSNTHLHPIPTFQINNQNFFFRKKYGTFLQLSDSQMLWCCQALEKSLGSDGTKRGFLPPQASATAPSCSTSSQPVTASWWLSSHQTSERESLCRGFPKVAPGRAN